MVGLTQISEYETEINYQGKLLVVKQPYDKMDRSLYLFECKNYFIQDAFPYLTEDEREFILTGIIAEEWDEMFGDEEE